jgi:NAD(P)H dehydrogenase (quinone)
MRIFNSQLHRSVYFDVLASHTSAARRKGTRRKMPDQRLILVAQAGGTTGVPAVEALLQRGLPVRALVHRIDERADYLARLGAEVISGDLLSFEDVSGAVAGVSGAYFCYPLAPGILEATSIFAQATSEAGVRAIVNMSQISARREAKSIAAQHHWLAERILDRTAMMTTHLRPTFFAEWLLFRWSRRNDKAVLTLPFGEGRHAPIAAADQGRVVAAILDNPGPHDRQCYPLTGPVEMDHHGIAGIMSSTLDIPVRYDAIDIPVFAEVATAQGFPQFIVQHLRSVAQDYQDGVFSGANNLVEVITGTPATSVAGFTATHRSEFDAAGDGMWRTRIAV